MLLYIISIIINLILINFMQCLPTNITQTTKEEEVFPLNTTLKPEVTLLKNTTIKSDVLLPQNTTVKSDVLLPQNTTVKSEVLLNQNTTIKSDVLLPQNTTVKPEVLLPQNTTVNSVDPFSSSTKVIPDDLLPKIPEMQPVLPLPQASVVQPDIINSSQLQNTTMTLTKQQRRIKASKWKIRTTTEVPETQEEINHEKLIKVLRRLSYGYPDLETGRRVAGWQANNKSNPEELGTYFEGDMLNPLHSSLTTRKGLIDTGYRWPLGIVFYRFAPTFMLPEIQVIQSAMNEYHKNTCIKFIPYTGLEKDFISIEKENTGCWSTLGRVGGKQIVNLQSPNCLFYVGTVIHELMHSIGFFHEQSRLDRDNSVTINWPSVIPGQEPNFDKYNSTSFNLAYDYGSVMHYSQTAFSKDGTNTIIPKVPDVTIGQRKILSPTDIAVIRTMYKCVGSISFV